jgi:hypothetical protein
MQLRLSRYARLKLHNTYSHSVAENCAACTAPKLPARSERRNQMSFAHCDTKRPDGCYIQFARLITTDECPDISWLDDDERRHDAYEAGEFEMIGVRAQARCLVVSNGVGTYINLESAGLWGIEGDSGNEYLDQVYAEELAALKDIIAAFANPTFEEGETE